MTRSTTRTITTSLKINLGAMVFVCLALASARAVPADPTADAQVLPGTMAYESGDVSESTSIVPPTGFEYAAGTYDGRDGGLETWDKGYGGTTDSPESGFGRRNGQNDDGGWWRWHKRCQSIPDGGSTVLLLGFGFLGLGLIERYLPQCKRAKA